MDKDENSRFDDDNEKVIVGQQQKREQHRNGRSDSDNEDINGQKSTNSSNKNKNDTSSKSSFESNDPKLENTSEAKENGGNDNGNEQESQIMTPAQWAGKNGIPVEWLKGFKSFLAMTKRYGTDDSDKFIQRIEEKIGRTVTFDEDTAIGNLFAELDRYRGNQQSNDLSAAMSLDQFTKEEEQQIFQHLKEVLQAQNMKQINDKNNKNNGAGEKAKLNDVHVMNQQEQQDQVVARNTSDSGSEGGSSATSKAAQAQEQEGGFGQLKTSDEIVCGDIIIGKPNPNNMDYFKMRHKNIPGEIELTYDNVKKATSMVVNCLAGFRLPNAPPEMCALDLNTLMQFLPQQVQFGLQAWVKYCNENNKQLWLKCIIIQVLMLQQV